MDNLYKSNEQTNTRRKFKIIGLFSWTVGSKDYRYHCT